MMNKQEKLQEFVKLPELKEAIGGRTIVFASIVGSQMYGLETPTSDFDFKVFVLPTFDDLYNNKEFTKQVKIQGNDVDIKDIRKLESLLEKASTPYIEAVSSSYAWYGIREFKAVFNYPPEIDFIKYAHSIKGMAMQKKYAIVKDCPTEPTNEGYKRRMKYGFDTKQLLHIFRLSNILKRICKAVVSDNPVKVFFAMKPFEVSLPEKEQLLATKSNKLGLNKDTALLQADAVLEDMNKDIEFIEENYKVSSQMEKDKKQYYDFMSEVIKDKIKESILGGTK